MVRFALDVIQLGRVTKELTELGGRTRPSFVDILTVLTEWVLWGICFYIYILMDVRSIKVYR